MTLEQLAQLLDDIRDDKEVVVNFARHDFLRYLSNYRHLRNGNNASDELRDLSREEEERARENGR